MTFAQRFRRVLFWALTGGALARLYVLGDARGWAIVGPVALRITGLTLLAWYGHLLIHEAGHLVASRLMKFQVDGVTLGPVEWNARTREWSWAGLSLGGKIATLPIGAKDLKRRLRVVAAAGPVMTLSALAVLSVVWVARADPITSNLGIAIVTGGLVLLSAATPGRFRAATAVAGNDIDQVLGGRQVIAHWTYLAVVQGVLSGGRPKDVTEGIDFGPLLPPSDEPPAAITLICAIHHLERQDFTGAKAVLDDAALRAAEALQWVHTDVFHQRGAIAALVDHDLDRAIACLDVVKRRQSLPWYADLLEACIAKASGDEPMAQQRTTRWVNEARAATGGRLAFGGNEWILDRLRPDWRC